MKSTKAKRLFKDRIGQANHFLITTLIGLDGIDRGGISNKPDTFSTSWSPRDIKTSVSRSRLFVLNSFLGWTVESLEMYLTELNRKPKELESERFTELYSKAGQSVYKKAIYIGEEIGVDGILIGMTELLITWRNYVFHYDIDNEIREVSEHLLLSSKDVISSRFSGLDIEKLLHSMKRGQELTFKEVASLIHAAHEFVEQIDAKAIVLMDREKYMYQHVKMYFTSRPQAIQKIKSLPHEKRTRYLKELIRNISGNEPDDSESESICDEIMGKRSKRNTREGTEMKKTDRQLGSGTTYDSPLLFSLGKQAVERCDGNGNFDTLTAMIMLFASFEGFINEVYQTAITISNDPETKGRESTCLLSLISDLDPSKANKKSTVEKYDCAWKIITGEKIDKTWLPRRSIALIEKIRNELIHSKSETTPIIIRQEGKPKGFEGIWLGTITETHGIPQFMHDIHDLKLIEKPNEKSKWTLQLCNQNVAAWAANCITECSGKLVSLIPSEYKLNSELKTGSIAYYYDA